MFVPVENSVAVLEDGSRLSLPRLPLLFDGAHAKPGRVPRLGEHNQAE
jgi:CoA:oxalate CoA-transferase